MQRQHSILQNCHNAAGVTCFACCICWVLSGCSSSVSPWPAHKIRGTRDVLLNCLISIQSEDLQGTKNFQSTITVHVRVLSPIATWASKTRSAYVTLMMTVTQVCSYTLAIQTSKRTCARVRNWKVFFRKSAKCYGLHGRLFTSCLNSLI